jgi:hypothetical protein
MLLFQIMDVELEEEKLKNSQILVNMMLFGFFFLKVYTYKFKL